MADGAMTGAGRRAAPDDVWEAVRADYLSGLSGPECCRRHGVSLTSLRNRAGRQGWRRRDQPWTPPNRLDPYDAGLELERTIGGNLDLIDFGDLPEVARTRVMRAVLQGDALAALRWRRVETLLQEDDDELRRWAEAEEYRAARRRRVASHATDAADPGDAPRDDSADAGDSVDAAHARDGYFYDD